MVLKRKLGYHNYLIENTFYAKCFWERQQNITKTRLFKYIENFISKNWKISDTNSDFFHISAKNIGCGYSLEPSSKYPQSMFLSRNEKK